MSTSRNSRFQSSVAGTAGTGRRPSYGASYGSSGIGTSYSGATAGSSSYGGTAAGYSGYSSSYGGGGSASTYGRSGYVPSSAAVANALSTSNAVLNSIVDDVTKPAPYSSLPLTTTSGYSSTTAGYQSSNITTTVTTSANNGMRSPLRRRFYSGANTVGSDSLQDLLRAAGCSDPDAVTAGAPKYAGSAAGSPAVVAPPIRRETTRSYRGARSNQELTLTDSGPSSMPSWMMRNGNGTSITNLDTAGTTTAPSPPIPTWRSKSLSSPTAMKAAEPPVTTASPSMNSYQHDYDNHAVTTRPYSRSSRSARLEHMDSRDRMETTSPAAAMTATPAYQSTSSRSRLDHMDSRDRMDSHSPSQADPETSYYTKPPAMDRVSSISREMGPTRGERSDRDNYKHDINYRVSSPREQRGTPHRERRPPPVETMYGDESPASPLRSRMPPSVSREDLVREYELIYTPKDGPTSQREKLANGGVTMDIPPPPMPSRSRRNPNVENYDTMVYETASASGGGRRRPSARAGERERNNVVGGYSNLVRSNSYSDLRDEARPPPAFKKRDRHQTLAYGVSAQDLAQSRARSYSKTDLSEWRAGQVRDFGSLGDWLDDATSALH